MSIKLNIRGGLTSKTKGKNFFEVNGKTLGECLEHLVILIPKLQETPFYKTKEGGKSSAF